MSDKSKGIAAPNGAMSSPFGKGQFQDALGTAGFSTVGTQQNFLPPFTDEEAKLVTESIISAGGKVISTSDDMLVVGLGGIVLRVSKVQ